MNGVRWCIRNNINFQESGALVALRYVADHRETFLENYAAKAERMIQRGRTSAPFAFVIPRKQRHAAEAADMVNLFRAHGAEIHVATSDFTLESRASTPPKAADTATTGAATASSTNPAQRASTPTTVHAGDWIVRLDQPYAATVRTLLAIQKFKADDPPPYDDTGWTLDALRHVETIKVSDSTILTRPMQLLSEDARVTGTVSGSGPTLLVKNVGDWRSAALPWKLGGSRVSVATAAFTADGARFPAGTFIIENSSSKSRDAIAALGIDAVATGNPVSVGKRVIALPGDRVELPVCAGDKQFTLVAVPDRQAGIYPTNDGRLAAWLVHRSPDPTLPADPADDREEDDDAGDEVPEERASDRVPREPEEVGDYPLERAEGVVDRGEGDEVARARGFGLGHLDDADRGPRTPSDPTLA